MQRRLLLAIGLMVGLMVLSNVVFPPIQVPAPVGTGADSVATTADENVDPVAGGAPVLTERPLAELTEVEAADDPAPAPEAEPAVSARIVTVSSDLYEYRFDTQGARMVGARLPAYPDFAPDRMEDGPVELIHPQDWILGYRIATGSDTVGLGGLVFDASAGDIDVASEGTELRFSAPIGEAGVTFDVTYRFSPTNYTVESHERGEPAGRLRPDGCRHADALGKHCVRTPGPSRARRGRVRERRAVQLGRVEVEVLSGRAGFG